MSDSESETRSTRAEKRSLPQAPNESCKRRAPYAQRACDACRRRKGRCDGGKACGYCKTRSIKCSYSVNTERDRRAILNGADFGGNSSQNGAYKDTKWMPE